MQKLSPISNNISSYKVARSHILLKVFVIYLFKNINVWAYNIDNPDIISFIFNVVNPSKQSTNSQTKFGNKAEKSIYYLNPATVHGGYET